MAICPKCHQEIPTRSFQAHLKECGESEKEYPPELYIPSAAPPWDRPDRGVLLPDPETKPGWVNYLMYGALAFFIGSLAVEVFGIFTHVWIVFP
jgi:hypothetical protein